MSDWLVCVDIDDVGSDARIIRAAPVAWEELRVHAASLIVTERDVQYDSSSGTVIAREVERLGAIELRERPLRDVPREQIAGALVAAIRAGWPDSITWRDADRAVRERLAFLHHLDPTWPDVSDAALVATLDDWLTPALGDARSLADVNRLDLGGLLMQQMGWARRAEMERLAPQRMEVPTGSSIAIDYADPAAPVLAVKLQELFGLQVTPTVGGGRVPLMLHMLSPARRPVAVTNDLARFWSVGYPDVRKDLRGRYPKHPWPEDPTTAIPMRGTKKKGV
jgi:ATP-dependent helicase HrpB